MDKINEFLLHNIELKYFYSSDIRDNFGKKIGTMSYENYKTPKGLIESNLWYKQAYELILKYDETYIFECLRKHVEDNLGWFKNKKDILNYALVLHISRIFENPEWLDYESFRKKYLDEV